MTETRTCQNCKTPFTIAPEDFTFYEKVNVPAPTRCFYCRLQRRMVLRNERMMYQRSCSLCKRDTVALYSRESPYQAYCHECYFSEKWDPMEFGVPYDFAKPFFVQFAELTRAVPRQALYQENNENCPWVNRARNCKNCHLEIGVFENENSAYNTTGGWCKESFDSFGLIRGELSYSNVIGTDLYKSFFTTFCFQCTEAYFAENCVGCSHIIGCVNLRNKEYCLFNKPIGKEEFARVVASFGSYVGLQKFAEQFTAFRNTQPHRFAAIKNSDRSLGDYLEKSSECLHCFVTFEMARCKYTVDCGYTKDSYDLYMIGFMEYGYENSCNGGKCSRVFFAYSCMNSYDVYYSHDLNNCHDVFGCIGLRNKSFCILNKQYSEEEYRVLLPKIIDHMKEMPYRDTLGREYAYGEFFPIEISPHAYNETTAQEQYFSLTKEEALRQGYAWMDRESGAHKITLSAGDLPDQIKDVPDTITKEVIACAHGGTCNDQCTPAFKIIPMELAFYRRVGLPLPRLCPNCRHYERVKRRRPIWLFQRSCACAGAVSDNGVYKNSATHFHGAAHCPREFETTFASERPEIVYCEECYQGETI